MKNYYHCFDGIHIPSIEIKNDLILIKCPKTKITKKMAISDYYDKYMKTCDVCERFPFYYYQKTFFCKDCMPKIRYKNSYNFLFNNFHCIKHNEYYNYYCKQCDIDLCNKCFLNHKNHLCMPDDKICYQNKILNRFISVVEKKIFEVKKIIDGMLKELNLYSSLIFDKDYVIIKEKIVNFENLKIFENIEEKEKIFVEKMNDLINELNYFKNFEYINKNKREINSKIDINDKVNHYHSFISEKNPNNNFINKSFNNNTNNIIDSNIILSKSMNIINNQKIEQINSEIFLNEISNLFEVNSIRLENIENKNKYINNKIINISNIFEDSDKLIERNEFLYSVGNIARQAHSFSYELAELLINKFNEKNKFSSIIYEKAKVELSSWVNQSLIIINGNDNNDIKDARKFYDLYCKKEINKIMDYIKIEEKFIIIYNKFNFNFLKLFRDLSQLYTEVLLYSGKNIEIKYCENDSYNYEYMKDINDKKYGRYVKCTILPGLFVNKEIIKNGKILVYCKTSKIDKDDFPKFNNPIKKDLNIKNTIKTANIKRDIKCELFVEEKILNSQYYIIQIITMPKIPEKDHPKFSILQDSGKEIEGKEENEFRIKKEKLKYKITIYGQVEINGITIQTRNKITFN